MTEPSAHSQIEHIDLRYTGDFAYPPADICRIRRVVRLIGRNKNVLDVGAFNGQLSRLIADAGNTVTAMDASSEALVAASARGLHTVHADVTSRWPIADESYDIVFAGEVIEHVIDTDFFLRECHRVLKRGGSLVVTTPNLASLGRRLLLLIGLNPMTDTALRPEQPGHVRYFVKQSLCRLIEENGFAIERVEGDYLQLSFGRLGIAWISSFFPTFSRCLIAKAAKR